MGKVRLPFLQVDGSAGWIGLSYYVWLPATQQDPLCAIGIHLAREDCLNPESLWLRLLSQYNLTCARHMTPDGCMGRGKADRARSLTVALRSSSHVCAASAQSARCSVASCLQPSPRPNTSSTCPLHPAGGTFALYSLMCRAAGFTPFGPAQPEELQLSGLPAGLWGHWWSLANDKSVGLRRAYMRSRGLQVRCTTAGGGVAVGSQFGSSSL
jgi:hypothetical protein